MIDSEVTPFDPGNWALGRVSWNTASNVWEESLIVTSLGGTRLLAYEEALDYGEGVLFPVWMLMHAETSENIGWVARSPNNDPIGDIHRALLAGNALSEHLRSFEVFLLDQGVMGGTWRFGKTLDGTQLSDRQCSFILPAAMEAQVNTLDQVSVFRKTQWGWRVLSGSSQVKIQLPTTRHAAMERRASLLQDVVPTP